MPTDKEAAAAYRLLAEYHQAEHDRYGIKSVQAEIFTGRADELDPPQPKWADDQWVVSSGGVHYKWSEANGCWFLGGDYGELVNVNDVYDPKPLRVLGDDEIAVHRLHRGLGAEAWRAEANDAQGAKRCTYAAASLCRAYADALDAEAGDAK